MLIAYAAVLGLIIGSFLNVVIWRVPRNESLVSPPSHCPRCDTPISPRDNIPVVSWLLLRGRCRHCGEPISARYPLVEVATGVVFAGLAARIGLDWALPAYLYLGAICVALALIDYDTKRLPNSITLPSYAVGIVLLGGAALLNHEPRRIVHLLIGMAALYAWYFLLWLVYPAGMGFGDVRLSGVLGMYLAYLGWGSLVAGAALGFFFGGVFSTLVLVLRLATRKTMVPYGPFMIAGALVGVFWGQAISGAYLRATGL